MQYNILKKKNPTQRQRLEDHKVANSLRLSAALPQDLLALQLLVQQEASQHSGPVLLENHQRLAVEEDPHLEGNSLHLERRNRQLSVQQQQPHSQHLDLPPQLLVANLPLGQRLL